MDDFLEQTARPKSKGFSTVLYLMMWTVIVVFGLIATFSLFSVVGSTPEGALRLNFIMLVPAVLFGGIAFLVWRKVDYCMVEYDFTFTNGTLDVGQVLNNRRRRYLTALETKEVTKCGPVNSQGFKKLLNDKELKRHNWFCNRDAKLYYFVFTKKGVRHLAVMELTEEMVALIRSKSYLQQGVWTDDSGKLMA